MPRHSRRRSRDTRKVRLLALAGVVAVCALALPLAVASAGSVGSMGGAGDSGVPDSAPGVRASAPRVHAAVPGVVRDVRDAVRPSPGRDGRGGGTPLRLPLGLGLSTGVRCGPELSTPDGIEAQTCVVTQGEDTWARTYYRNMTGDALDAVLSLMGPGGRNVQMHCAVGVADEPGTCETPRERTRGDLAAYTAVAEFASRGGSGPLLLRSASNGSNSSAKTGT